MKTIRTITTLSCFLVLTSFGFAQETVSSELQFEVNKIYPYISISKQELKEAQTISDFNNEVNDLHLSYKTEWIKEFISVDISTTIDGQIHNSTSKDEVLTPKQKAMMLRTDSGASITIHVKYIPNNDLKTNEAKELSFTCSIDPKFDAKYPTGQEQLKKYLKEKAINKIPANSYQGYEMSAIKFTIDEEGKVVNVHNFGAQYQASHKEAIDQLLLEAISNMPCWEPAQYADETTIAQEFVLTVGNMKNCVIHMLNIQ